MKILVYPAIALALLTAPVVAATAGSPKTNVVKFNDLDLDSEVGKQALEVRIKNTARRICDAEQRTGSRISSSACFEDVRKQVLAQVESYQNRTGKGG